MSSNIKVQRICQHCGTEFTAKTTVTQYCGDSCAKQAYKSRVRTQKVELSNMETQLIRTKPIEELQAKEYLTITETCKLLSVSRWTIWRAIKNEDLPAGKIGRRTLIKHSDLNRLFKQNITPDDEDIQKEQRDEVKEWADAGQFEIAECYNLKEVQDLYSISESALQDLIKRNNIPKIKYGWFAYVPKIVIDKLLK
ncbi:MAG: helix-turn-helix domain-containing protein [Bacteroidales bacterium]|nr:helix-turn-helix domain-containing protein [Bacteroidales bacterium]